MLDMQNNAPQGPASVHTGAAFWRSSSGMWAAQRLTQTMLEGKPFRASALRVNGVLRKDEWIAFDNVIAESVSMRLAAVADLAARGLVRPLPNAMGRTVFEYQRVGDLDAAATTMDGMARVENDRMEFDFAQLPIPIVHKDFFFNLRTLLASRNRGEGLDVTHVRAAGRKVAEEVERQLVQGGSQWGGLTVYGYMNHPNRNTGSFGTNGAWHQAVKTGENILADVDTMRAALAADGMYGPYMIYTPANAETRLDADYKAASTTTTRERILQLPNILGIRSLDLLPSGNVLMVQMTPDVVEMLDGEPYQTVQWDVQGGFGINFKCFAIQVPLVRNGVTGKSGIYHMA
jgi:hypothetical protein